MSNHRSSSGVRTLRAMFENGDSPSQDTGRSSNGRLSSATADGELPSLTKVRSSFVAVDGTPVKQENPAEERGTPDQVGHVTTIAQSPQTPSASLNDAASLSPKPAPSTPQKHVLPDAAVNGIANDDQAAARPASQVKTELASTPAKTPLSANPKIAATADNGSSSDLLRGRQSNPDTSAQAQQTSITNLAGGQDSTQTAQSATPAKDVTSKASDQKDPQLSQSATPAKQSIATPAVKVDTQPTQSATPNDNSAATKTAQSSTPVKDSSATQSSEVAMSARKGRASLAAQDKQTPQTQSLNATPSKKIDKPVNNASPASGVKNKTQDVNGMSTSEIGSKQSPKPQEKTDKPVAQSTTPLKGAIPASDAKTPAELSMGRTSINGQGKAVDRQPPRSAAKTTVASRAHEQSSDHKPSPGSEHNPAVKPERKSIAGAAAKASPSLASRQHKSDQEHNATVLSEHTPSKKPSIEQTKTPISIDRSAKVESQPLTTPTKQSQPGRRQSSLTMATAATSAKTKSGVHAAPANATIDEKKTSTKPRVLTPASLKHLMTETVASKARHEEAKQPTASPSTKPPAPSFRASTNSSNNARVSSTSSMKPLGRSASVRQKPVEALKSQSRPARVSVGGAGFLERMTRQTASSKSKVHEPVPDVKEKSVSRMVKPRQRQSTGGKPAAIVARARDTRDMTSRPSTANTDKTATSNVKTESQAPKVATPMLEPETQTMQQKTIADEGDESDEGEPMPRVIKSEGPDESLVKAPETTTAS